MESHLRVALYKQPSLLRCDESPAGWCIPIEVHIFQRGRSTTKQPKVFSVTSLKVMSQLLVDDGRFGARRVLLQLRPVWHIFLPYGLLSILSRRSNQLISAVGFLWISRNSWGKDLVKHDERW